jgi:NAD(P)-dependent dehydrogenase (short-subunit alcohol dehydrogenase family)
MVTKPASRQKPIIQTIATTMTTTTTKKQHILITGASQGFGADAAKALAKNGHTVYASLRDANGRNKEKKAALEKFAADNKVALSVIELDVTNQASVDAAVAGIPHLDVLINNAGIGTFGLSESYSADLFKTVYDVNVFGAARVTNAVLPRFRKAGSGYIIFVSSGLGRIIIPFLTQYTSSKFALEAYAESTAYELAPLNIPVTILQPGAYGTGFGANSTPADNAQVLKEYGAVAELFGKFANHFAENAKSGKIGNPVEIEQGIVALVELEHDKKPLRKAIGKDVEVPVGALNKAHNDVQTGLLNAFHLGALQPKNL